MAAARRRQPPSPPIALPADDFSTRQPVTHAVYRIYADQYSYDRTPFDVRVESTDRYVGRVR